MSDGKKLRPVLASRPHVLVAERFSLVHAMHAYTGKATDLILAILVGHDDTRYQGVHGILRMLHQETFQQTTGHSICTRDAPLYKGSVVEIDEMGVGIQSLNGNKSLLLAVNKPSRFSFACSLPSIQEEGRAQHPHYKCIKGI